VSDSAETHVEMVDTVEPANPVFDPDTDDEVRSTVNAHILSPRLFKQVVVCRSSAEKVTELDREKAAQLAMVKSLLTKARSGENFPLATGGKEMRIRLSSELGDLP
jgi:hypothetical protein